MDFFLIIGIIVFLVLAYLIVLYLTDYSEHGCKDYCQQGRLPCICNRGKK